MEQVATSEKREARKLEREEKRLNERFARELRRGRVTERTKNEIFEAALRDFATRIYTEKKARIEASNTEEAKKQLSVESSTISEEPTTVTTGDVLANKPTIENYALTSVPTEGGGSGCKGLQIYQKNKEIWLGTGTIAGKTPVEWGADPLSGIKIADGGSGYVFANVQINGTTGNVNSVSVGSGSAPTNSTNSFYYILGYFFYDNNEQIFIFNYGCGNLEYISCRNWFVQEISWRPVWSR